MSEVRTWQHIYANVEKDQSPRGIAGFQTLFYTTSVLTEAEVEEMEARLLYFRSEIEPVKRVFFETSTGRVVVGQITPLPTPDRSGRKGRYIAHSFVFDSDQFACLGANPFNVFRSFEFASTLGEAMQSGDLQTGEIAARTIRSFYNLEHELRAAAKWSRQELRNLTMLALRTQQLLLDRSVVAFVGETQDIEEALESAFFAVPIPLRRSCSFDTYFYKCNLVATYYWGVGIAEPPSSPNFIVVDTASRQTLTDLALISENTYERWIGIVLETEDLQTIASYREYAYALSEWLDERSYEEELLESIPQQVVESVFQTSTEQVRSNLLERLNDFLPPILAENIAEYIYTRSSNYELFSQLRQGFQVPRLLDILAAVYAERNYSTPQRNEFYELGTVLQQHEHSVLQLLYACWANKHDKLRDTLKQIDDVKYRQFAENAIRFGLVEPLKLLVSGKGMIFIDLYIDLSAGEIDWVSLVRLLLDASESHCFEPLTPYVCDWSPKELRAVDKLLRGRELPQTFRDALDQALAATHKRRGAKTIAKSFFSWRPRKRNADGVYENHNEE